jgi:hypothetical protein
MGKNKMPSRDAGYSVATDEDCIRLRIYDGEIPLDEAGAKLLEITKAQNLHLQQESWELREQVISLKERLGLKPRCPYPVHRWDVIGDMRFAKLSIGNIYGQVERFLRRKGTFVSKIEALHCEDNEDGVILRMKFSKKDADDGSDDKRHIPG